MDIALDTLGDQLPIVHGIYADGSHLAASIARRAEHAGASALLIFPSATFAMGGMLRPEMAPCVRVVVAFNEAVKDESKIHSVVQTASG